MPKYRIIEKRRGRDRIFLDDIKTQALAKKKARIFRSAYAGSGLLGRIRVVKKK